jgi:hypothetical protein
MIAIFSGGNENQFGKEGFALRQPCCHIVLSIFETLAPAQKQGGLAAKPHV